MRRGGRLGDPGPPPGSGGHQVVRGGEGYARNGGGPTRPQARHPGFGYGLLAGVGAEQGLGANGADHGVVGQGSNELVGKGHGTNVVAAPQRLERLIREFFNPVRIHERTSGPALNPCPLTLPATGHQMSRVDPNAKPNNCQRDILETLDDCCLRISTVIMQVHPGPRPGERVVY